VYIPLIIGTALSMQYVAKPSNLPKLDAARMVPDLRLHAHAAVVRAAQTRQDRVAVANDRVLRQASAYLAELALLAEHPRHRGDRLDEDEASRFVRQRDLFDARQRFLVIDDHSRRGDDLNVDMSISYYSIQHN
jgi:hypothetical protein